MALRKGKIVEAAGVQRSAGAGEKEEILGIRTEEIEIPLCAPAPLPPCSSAILTLHTFQLNLVPFGYGHTGNSDAYGGLRLRTLEVSA
ncbi:hypothetical protein LC608_36385 [Nostoc sp. XA010]|uniref:hypothetical protein n=1 Tax=Nostoc sp. XA010 TaxID=2780407 RepID=UPI001E589909|nr:hypothetical protein [Nostoc sp. XA010]MCC5662287.1 hypothetical protein [Nostoc sp. XA010]